MKNNLFVSLFKFRPRPTRKPLEDFATECLAYLLREDSKLMNKLLALIFSDDSLQITDYKVHTQHLIPTGNKIDLAIFWMDNFKKHSLFLEHKINSSPWEQHSEEGEVYTQIDAYCNYQEYKNISKDNCHHTALISRYPVRGYSILEKHPSYLGNFTWRQVASLIRSLLKDNNNMNIIHTLEYDFIKFMGGFNMAGFENININELASINVHESYMEKLISLTTSITQAFRNNEGKFKEYGLKRSDAWGESKIGEHYGVIFHDEDKASDASIWIFIGVSTTNPPTDEHWYLSLSHKHDKIPDVESVIYMWFDDLKLKDFIDENNLMNDKWDYEKNYGYELSADFENNILAIYNRKPLSEFLISTNQEEEILNYLKINCDKITEVGSFFEKIIKSHQKFISE